MEPLLILMLFAKIWMCTPEEDADSLFLFALDNAGNGDTIMLQKGTYEARQQPFTEAVCGNCENPSTVVEATVGFHIKGKALIIKGEARDSTVLVTNAGYGILFEESYGSVLSNITITGGIRDPDGNATDAAIVGKQCRVMIENVAIRNNTHRIDTVVVGIGGIFGREGAELLIFNNEIINNGWDGIALYRGATATIADNTIKKGRGAGIGITWDAAAIVYRNRISEYWKGIGAFGESTVLARNNSVFDNLGWGIVATGNAYMAVENNVIFHNGNCGFAVWQETARGFLRNNIIEGNGWKEEWVCPCVGVWMNAAPEQFPVTFNNVWENSAGDYEGMADRKGIDGNISADPLFENAETFRLQPASPCIDTGDSIITDSDGSRSDMGIHGGPQARSY
jgi:parallel beta-helix repeat protein